ncbi:UDP-galactose 4-epimerase [Breoghania corrubedonensis]|uniref:UDP-glucose 4-epimerase n=1 Tax=Breoghania corrubedonensis TaxID=665038 RepID=A0A2T5VIH1_9HYPH|nr:UDP-glucose 4-epimerase GalE [Breoghania corrubedonensis]PTW63557.1 UDP-galactose 4-epimerase [Breoghania corrubedonensis]
MAVLVTGGAGYIGSHMVWNLVEAGEQVVVLDNLSTGFDWAVAGAARLVCGDVGDADLLDELLKGGIDAVIHFAGSVIVPESVADPLKYYRNNTASTRALIEACVMNGVRRFIFSSTAAVYGDPEVVPVGEDAPVHPLSPYGSSKLMSEIMLADTAAAHDFAFTALRYFNVAGADPGGRTGQSTANATHLIKVACEAALGKRSHLSVFGTDYDTPDGTGVRDYIHVADLVEAHRLALAHLRDGGQSRILNCGYGEGYSVRQVIESARRVSGCDFKVVEEPRRLGDAPQVVARADAVRRELGWQPRYDDLDTIIAHALAWEDRLSRRNPAR